ncbi:MAG: metallophosphoesterase, partial [Candidatus Latescibacteria bacterium]|nr:metallophosphoesterase [Candidatus Latescibacterota bacterium]
VVNPVPHLESCGEAIECFRSIFSKLKSPLHVIPGNHDIGDKPVDWMPASNVNDRFIRHYEENHGRHYSLIAHRGCRFVFLNAQLFNSGHQAEREQQCWLESELEASGGQRSFVFMHYPPFITHPDEDTNYDNLDEPARTWLLEILAKHKVTALYAGHVHNLMFNRYGDLDLYVLPSTCFVRHDYAEMFRDRPADEYGRNDASKLGLFIVRVYEDGQVNRFVRSNGATLGPDEVPGSSVASLHSLHSDECTAAPVGLELRHPWTEEMDIPASGAIEEFGRKRVRNDYPLFALWEMGAAAFRLPLQDLLDPGTRARIEAMAARGQRFRFYAYGVPTEAALDSISGNRSQVDALEIALRPDRLDASLPRMQDLHEETGVPSLLSFMRSGEGHGGRATYKHLVDHGFLPNEGEVLGHLFGRPDVRRAFQGALFRVNLDRPPLESLESIAAVVRDLGIRTSVMLRIAANSLAESNTDDRAICCRVAETLAAAHLLQSLDVFFDTLIDVDRSYFARNGFYDRLCNPRSSAHVFRHLNTLLQHHPPDSVTRDGSSLRISSGEIEMVLAVDGSGLADLEGERLDLLTGEIVPHEAGATHSWPTLVFSR